MWKARLNQVILVSRTAFKWGWIPFLIYLGERGSEAGLALRELNVTGAFLSFYAGIRRGSTDPGVPSPSLFQCVVHVILYCVAS